MQGSIILRAVTEDASIPTGGQEGVTRTVLETRPNVTSGVTGLPSPPAPHTERIEALGSRTAFCSTHYMMLVPRKVPALCAPSSIFQEQKSPTSPFRVLGAHLITPRDACSHSPRTGHFSHLTLQLGKCFGPKSKAYRQPRQTLPRGEGEHDDSAQPQPFQGTRFLKALSRTHPFSPNSHPGGCSSLSPLVQKGPTGAQGGGQTF